MAPEAAQDPVPARKATAGDSEPASQDGPHHPELGQGVEREGRVATQEDAGRIPRRAPRLCQEQIALNADDHERHRLAFREPHANVVDAVRSADLAPDRVFDQVPNVHIALLSHCPRPPRTQLHVRALPTVCVEPPSAPEDAPAYRGRRP